MSCPVCESSRTRPFLRVGAYHYHDCGKCRSAFLPGRTIEDQTELHASDEYTLKRIEAEKRNARHNSWIVARLKEVLPKGDVLEVGAGFGFLVAELCKAGYSATGVDLGEETTAFADRELNVRVDSTSFLDLDGSYDVLMMHQLIEHLANPRAFLAHAKHLLKANGLLMLSTPNLRVARLLAKLPRPVLGDALGHPPSHCVLFEPQGLRDLLESLGFHGISIENNPTGLRGASWLRHRADWLLGRVGALGPNMLVLAHRG